MAIVTFGATFRGSNAGFALLNTTTSNVTVPLLGFSIAPGATEVVPFGEFDGYVRNPRHTQVYGIGVNGLPYQDDVADLAANLGNGHLIVKAATTSDGGLTFTVGASSAATALADGSVFFA